MFDMSFTLYLNNLNNNTNFLKYLKCIFMMNIAKIIPLLLATGHFWSNWAPCIGKTTFMGQHGAP